MVTLSKPSFEDRLRGRSLDQLTVRQREVLDHLAGHKTSKEIARDLHIHENTVDKHLAAVREKWGTFDRYATVRVFKQLLDVDGNHPPQIPSSDGVRIGAADELSDLPETAEFRLSDVMGSDPFRLPDSYPPKGLEALDAKFGKAWRIAAIPVVALVIGMVTATMLAIAWVLTELL